MAQKDPLRKRKNPPVEDDADRHHTEPLDIFEEDEKAFSIHCPECARAQKHVILVKTEGENLECPECHYLRLARRM